MYCIYLLRNVSGLGYVGSTKNLNNRMAVHRYEAKHNHACSSKQLFVEDVTVEVLEEVETKEEARIREKHYIESLSNLVNIQSPFRTKEEKLKYERDHYYKHYEELRPKKTEQQRQRRHL